MPRKPNYRFERSERERLKLAKKEARLAEKQQRSLDRQTQTEQSEPTEDKPKDPT